MAGLPPFGEDRSLAKHAKYAKDGTAEIINGFDVHPDSTRLG